ncbi:MAG: T9SS type A sorting domain-containing protein [Lewinella sp.]|nr:T9SS type A sorting domain-containing protein [Lewinella sp.]
MSIDGGCNQNGAIWIDIYNGSPNYTITWTGPQNGTLVTDDTSLDIPNVPPGTYTVTITDGNGCSGTQTVVISTGSNLGISLTPQTGDCGQSGSLLVNISGGSPTYLVSWTGPQSGTTTTNVNSVDLTGLVPGIYTVTVTDSEGCQSSATAQITSSGGNLTLQTFLTHATCGSTGAIGLEVFGGTAPYQVSWTGPIGGALTSNDQWIDITGLPAGTYHIYVTDANGCTAEATVTILNQGSNLTISLVGNDAICDLYGNIGVYVTNGTAPYTISWSGPIAGATTTNSAVYQIQNTPAGTYNVVVTDANGCTTSGTVTVVAVNQLQATLTPTNGECGDNGILTLNITAGTGPFQVIWSGPTSGSVTTPNTLFTLNDLPSGTYTVVVTDNHGCTRSFTRTINNTDGGIDLQASLIYNECGQYNTIWVDVFGGTPPYTITWQGPQNGGVTVPTGEYEIMDLPPGTYKVIVVDANGCMDMQSGIIVYPAPITLFTATPNNGICGEDGSIVIDILDGTPNYTLTWTGPINGSAVLTGGQYTMAGLPSGTYTLTLVDANGCAQTQTVVINNTVSNVEIVASLIYNECGQYNTIWVDIFGGTPPYTITWTGTQNGSVTVPTGEYEIMDLPPGTYKVTVVDANGCMDMQQGIIIYPAPIDLFTATPFNGICGENGSIVVDILAGTPPYVLSWSGPVSGSMGMNSGPYTIGNLPSGTYTIVLTDANGCAETETVVINNAPGGSVDVQVSLIYNECGQYNTLWVDIFGGTPPYVITWTGTQNGSVTTNTGAYEIMDLPPGTYKVTVVDANGCMDMQQDLIIYPAPIDLFTATPVSGFCSGPGAINVDIFGGTPDYTLSWSGPMSGSVVVSGPAYSITGLVTGTYTITLVDMNGCAETEVVTVTSTEGDIAITPTANTGTCVSNPSIMIEVDGGEPGYTINWSGPESGSATFDGSMYIIPDLLPGQYTVQVTDSQGCDDQANVNVTQAEDDLGISVTANPGDCGSNGSLDVLISGGQSPYLVSWSGPSSGDQVAMGSSLNIPNLPDGVYTVSVMDTNGCTDELVITLASPEDDLVVSLTPLNGVCGQPGSINVFYSGGSAPYTVTWMGPSPGSVTIPGNSVNLPNLPAGTYTVTVSSGDCSDTAMTTLTNNTDNLSVSLTPNNGDCGNLGSLGVNISGGFAPYTISWNGPSMGSTTTDGTFLNIPNLASGAYEVTVMSGTCTESATASISNIPDNLSVSAIGTNGECGGLGTIVVNIMGGAPPYMVTWSGPIDSGTLTDDNTVVIPDLPDGTYSIFVLNGSCSDVAQVTISNSPNGLFITATPNNGICDAPGSIDLTFGGGIPPYTINWSGPSSGSTTANGNTFTVPNLPSGTYTFTVLNGGCSRSNTATLNNTPNSLFLNATPTAGNCGSDGSITLSFGGGSSPYTISWSGAENGSVTTAGPTYTIPSLSSGTYNITLSSGGCTTTTTTTLDNGQQASISITATALPEPCGVYGDILVNISGGTAPYTLHWAGPVTGSSTVNGSAFTIQDLPGGTYTLTVFDDNNCGNSTFIYLPASTLNLFVSAANGTCGDNGFLDIYFANGQAPYTLTWTGPVSGSISPSPTTYIVPNLPSGAYTVTVEDANGCTDTETVTITNTEGDFYVVHMVGSNGCGQYSNIWMDFYEGEAPYTINWSGPVSGTASTNQNFYDIVNVPSGVYTITVIDGLGCVDVQTVTVVNIANDLEVTFSPANGSCGGPGKIGVTTEGGTPPYQVSWQGSSSSGSVTTNLTYYVINNLPAGSYNVWLTDANGCEVNAIVQVSTPFSGMQVQNTVIPPGCSGLGAVGLIMGSSQPPYDISWEGQQTGSAVSNVGNYMLTGLAPGEYLILITDANGCVGFAEITMPGGPAGTITADFTATVDEMTIDFDNHSNAGSYLWTFGDGSQSTSTHPTHTYTQPGTYEVCLTVSAACGSDTYCQFFTVMPAADVALLDVGDGAAGPGGTVNVPVTIQHLDNLISLTGSLALADPSVAEVIGLTPGLINPQFNAGNLSFSFFNSGGAPLAVTDGQVLFYVQVTLTGQVGESSLLSLVNAPLPVTISSMVSGSPTAIAHNELPGTVSVTNMGQLAGLINTYWGGPIANAEVHLSGGGYDEFIMTDENGYYELPPATLGTDYTVDPFKDTDPTNGLSTYALFVGQRFLLGMEPAQITSPYQVIAGDANCNDAFTTLDLFLIQQLILGTNDEFSNCPSWVFVAEGQDMPAAFDAYNVFPYISAPSFMLMHDTTANFVGVKVGDILGQAEPGNRPGGGLPAEPRNGEELIFRAPNASVSAGQEVTLYFNSPNFEEVVSYQFGLLFDPAQMEFLGFEPSSVEPFQTVAVGNNDAAEGKLRLSWFSLDGFGHSANPATTLFGLRFRALTPISDWGEILRISPVDMLPEAYNQAEQPLEPVLEFVNTTATWEANGLSFALEQNVPNPFRHETVIGFTLPEASETVFTVHDALGRKVWEQQRHYGAGHQMIRLDEQVLTPGVYHYTLRAGGQTASRSMVVLE